MTRMNCAGLEATHRQLPDAVNDSWTSSEVDHRVANSFSLIAATIAHQARQVAKQQQLMSGQDVSFLLHEIGSRVAAVGRLHRDIARQPKGFALDLNEHLRKLCDDLLAALARPGQFELIHSATSPCTVPTTDVLPVCLIVTEVVSNSLKYAHPAGVPGKITMGCYREADGSICIDVADDGVGLPDGFSPETAQGLGSQTVRLLARKLRAEISIESGSLGLSFRLRLLPSSAQNHTSSDPI
jgi:two-component sensor histidine kinase